MTSRDRSEPGPLYTMAVWGGLLFGGAGVGSGLVALVAPASDMAAFVGFITLPLVFGFGMKAWYAAATAAMGKRLVGTFFDVVLRRRDLREAAQANFADLEGNIPGTGAFVFFGCLGGIVAGALTWIGSDVGLGLAFGSWLVLSGGYGYLVRWLARSGRLPLPDQA